MSRYTNLKVLVHGDHMIDHTIYCDPKRLSQEAPVIILKQKHVEYQLGGAANVAKNISALGAHVMVAGTIGQGKHNKIMRLLFEKEGIGTGGLRASNRPTTLKTRIVAQGRQLIRYDNEEKTPTDYRLENKMIESIKRFNPDIIVIADYDKGNVTRSMIHKLQKLNKPIYVNGKPEHVDLYYNIHCLVCNDYEYKHSMSSLETMDLRQTLGCQAIVHTQGDKGLNIVTANGTEYMAPHKVQEVDPTGASDTIISVVALEEQVTNITNAAKLANKAASIIVTKPGTQCITYKDIEKAISLLFSTNEGVDHDSISISK